MYPNGQGHRRWWMQPWFILAILGAVLIVSGLGVTVVGRSQSAALEAQLTGLEQEAEIASSRLALAREEYEANHLLYADRWSGDLEEALYEAEQSIGEEGEFLTLLERAREAQGRDRGEAYDLSNRADSLQAASNSALDTILGPPGTEGGGLYDTLARKSS